MRGPQSTGDNPLPEYDAAAFAGAKRGKYAKRFKSGTNLVKLDADVAASFPDEKAVNDALRFLQQLGSHHEPLPLAPNPPPYHA